MCMQKQICKNRKGTFIYGGQQKEEVKQTQETEIKLSEEEKAEETKTENSKDQGLPGTSVGLMLLAGFYLVYTGYKLCSNVLAGEEGASWGFMVAGIAFLVIGAGMLFVSGKNLLRRNQAKREAAEQERETEFSAGCRGCAETDEHCRTCQTCRKCSRKRSPGSFRKRKYRYRGF